MIDFIGNNISTGDSVIMIAPGYRNFTAARVTGFTGKRVRVSFNAFHGWHPYCKEMLQYPEQLIRVAEAEATEER